MLLKNPRDTDPTVKRNQKHVVTVCGRPIRHRHAHLPAGHKPTHSNEEQCCQRGKNGETVQPRIVVGPWNHPKTKQARKKQVLTPSLSNPEKNYHRKKGTATTL
jgi:hypothetical protein